MAIAQKVAGYTLGSADLLRRAMGKKKKEILDKEFVPFARRHAGQRLLRRGDQDAVGHPRPVLRLRVQQGAHRRLRPGLLLDRATSRRTTRPSTWPRCSPQRRRRQGQDRRSTWPSAGGWASRCCRPTSTSPTATFTPVGTDIRFGLAAVRNVGANVVDVDRARPARRRARSPTSPTSCARSTRSRLQQADDRVADQGGRVRLARAHPRSGLLAVHAEAIDAVHRRQAQRGDRPVRPVRRRSATPRPAAVVRRRRSRRRVGQDRPARLRARDARPVRLRPPAARRRARRWPRTADSWPIASRCRGAERRRSPRRRRSSRRPASCPGCSARSPSRATPGPSPRWRTSTARSRCCSSRTPTSSASTAARRGRDRGRQGPGRPARRDAQADRDGDDAPDLSADPRPGRRVAAGAAVLPPVVDRLKEVLRTHPGRPRCT